jgi:hypothetical protein
MRHEIRWSWFGSRGRSRAILFCGLLALCMNAANSAQPGQPSASLAPLEGRAAWKQSPPTASLPKLPPLPAGVSDLKFCDFFVQPMGRRGLEFTEKVRDLDGQRVRILGFMVRQENAPPGVFLLAPIPVELHERESDCFIDNLPAAVLHVFMPPPAKPVPHTPGLMLLTGILSLGNRLEADGRVSVARLALDRPVSNVIRGGGAAAKGAERLITAAGRKPEHSP